jgi:Arc/MetJ family transcription regulator
VRTNIDIDDELMKKTMAATNTTTKKAAVEASMRLAVQLKAQEGIRALRGKVKWEGNLDEMRQGRYLNWQDDADKEGLKGRTLSELISKQEKAS